MGQAGGMTDWWLDERAFAGAEHLDARYVAGYDAKAGFDPAPDIGLLCDLGLDRSGSVVDLGAGTGVFSLAAARVAGAVTAVDVSPAMVAALEAKLRASGVANVTVVQAGLLSYDHAGGQTDIVFCRNTLHQLPDFWKVVALQRIAAMLRPGGVLRLRDLAYELDPAQIAGAVDDPAEGFTGPELAEHVRSEFSTFTWLLEPMLDRCGFDVVDRETIRSAYAAYTCRRR